jgi:hypothetical protein
MVVDRDFMLLRVITSEIDEISTFWWFYLVQTKIFSMKMPILFENNAKVPRFYSYTYIKKANGKTLAPIVLLTYLIKLIVEKILWKTYYWEHLDAKIQTKQKYRSNFMHKQLSMMTEYVSLARKKSNLSVNVNQLIEKVNRIFFFLKLRSLYFLLQKLKMIAVHFRDT